MAPESPNVKPRIIHEGMAPPAGVEPTTYRLGGDGACKNLQPDKKRN
jgi:hypothetical protein